MLEAISDIGSMPSNSIKHEHNDDGIIVWYERDFHGSKRCSATFVKWGKSQPVQWCVKCNESYDGNSAQPCFSCLVGLK